MSEITEKQLAANRQNAKLSTGPRTTEGKTRVRFNAIKHGLLAKSVVITTDNELEHKEDLEDFLRQLSDDLQPVGALEELLIEEIASIYWRLRRSARVEAAAIERRLQERDYEDEDGPIGAYSLPYQHTLELVRRYETTHSRRLHRAIDRLVRLQTSRKQQI